MYCTLSLDGVLHGLCGGESSNVEENRREEEEEEEEEKEKRSSKKIKGMELYGILKFCMGFHEIVWISMEL